jgi:hypothetical protein
MNGIVMLLLLVLLTVLLRDGRRAAIAVVVVLTLTVPIFPITYPLVDFASNGLLFAGGVALLVRCGVLAMISCMVTSSWLAPISHRFDPSVPPASSSYLLVGLVLGLAAFGSYAALGRRPVLGPGLLREEPGGL